jgi:transposase
MTSEATLTGQSKACVQVLYMALELSDTAWKVLFASPAGRRRERNVAARDLAALLAEIALAKERLRLPAKAKVVSCYEAGRDGFWLDRALRCNGVDNVVVDSSSIEVPRRLRRRKTDRVDVIKLLELLLRWSGGERGCLSVVRVPPVAAEDIRQLSRTIERLKSEHGRHVTRIKALLAKEGLKLPRIGGRDWADRVAGLRTWDGAALGRWLQQDLILEGERLALVAGQLSTLKAERDQLIARAGEGAAGKARQLMRLGAIAWESSFVFATELFGWRTFANRRQLAGAVGIVPTPYKSGRLDREQGVSKAGNRRMRTMLVEIAWCWLRYQPHSALSQWWQRRFGRSSGRMRKVAIGGGSIAQDRGRGMIGMAADAAGPSLAPCSTSSRPSPAGGLAGQP